MPHPHASFLKEFQCAIDKMRHYAPPELIEEAQKIHDDLVADSKCTEAQIHDALVAVGKKEFPYRKAYHDLCASDEEQRLQSLVLERLDEQVKQKVVDHTKHGVLIDHYVKSKLFEEELTPEERLQIENAILLAEDVLNSQCDERAGKRHGQFGDLIKKWTADRDRLQKMIDSLKGMVAKGGKWAEDIQASVNRLEESWSVAELQVNEEEIKKELEYWDTVLHEVEDEATA
jgi:hypothetical protein